MHLQKAAQNCKTLQTEKAGSLDRSLKSVAVHFVVQRSDADAEELSSTFPVLVAGA
jgi:hypothetical protein